MGDILRITNANVYLDNNSLLGTVEEFTGPEIKQKMTEHKALGLDASLEFRSGTDKMEARLKFNSFYPEVMKKAGNPYKSVKLQIRSASESYQGGDRTSLKANKVFITGQFKNFPTGNYKQHDNIEIELLMTVTRIKHEFDGLEILEYDAMANIHRVNGVDLLAGVRAIWGV